MTQEQTSEFKRIVEELSTDYPHRNIELRQEFENEYIYIDGECKFCITDYDLLFNLTRLCQHLSKELI